MTYEEVLKDIVTGDERYVVLTAENRAAIRSLPLHLGDRFIDTGITEQTLIGVSCGLALRGRIPIAHALATFLTMRAFEFIRTDIGLGGLPVKIVGGFPGFLSEANGPTHQAIEDVSLMRGIPNMNVFCPADEDDLVICMRKVIEFPSPFYIRYNNVQSQYKHSGEFEIGKAEVVAEGTDVTLLVYGVLFNQTLEVKNILEADGLSVGLINIRTPKPFDDNLLLETAAKTKLLVTIEDHFLTGGLYSILSELFIRNRVMYDVLPFGLDSKWFKPSLFCDILEYEGFTPEKITKKILSHIKRDGK